MRKQTACLFLNSLNKQKMKQTYHANATTNVRLRKTINQSNLTNLELSEQYGISQNTVSKWRNRDEFEDKSSRPKNIKYALSDLETLICIHLRMLTWWALDEIAEVINPVEPTKIRSAIYRTFVREEINTVPKKEKEKARGEKEMQKRAWVRMVYG